MNQYLLKLFKGQTSDAPAVSEAPSDAILKDILAFRTITTLLSQLPRAKPIDPVIYSKQSFEPSTKLELRISGALAYIAVIEHDIVAITSHRAPGEGGVQLRLVVCANQASPTDEKPISSSSTTLEYLRLAFTKNPRQKDHGVASEQLSVTRPGPPADLDGQTIFQYIRAYLGVWKEPLKLSNHLWILSQILVMPQNMTILNYTLILPTLFTSYILSICRNKIQRRINNPLSVQFYESLQNVKSQDIPIISHADALDIIPQDIYNDRSVIMDSVAYYKDDERIKDKIPNLIELAEAGLPRNNDKFVIYTNKTSGEFHEFLIFLLIIFRDSLKQMTTRTTNPVEGQTKDGKSPVSQRDYPLEISAARNAGYALLRISRGHAIKMHMVNIASMLQIGRKPLVSKGVDAGVDDELDDIWSDLESPKREQETSFLHPYINWLRLMVGHIDAADILIQHVSTTVFRYTSIDIDIVVAPKMDGKMLPWRELFHDTTYISENSINSVSGTTIKTLLEDRLCILSLAPYIKTLLTLCQSPDDFKFNDFSQALVPLTNTTHTGISTTANSIKALVQPAKNKIVDKLKVIEGVNTLGTYIDGPKPEDHFIRSLNNQNVFKGTVHCEALLASILPVYMTKTLMATDAIYGAQLKSACKALEPYGNARIIGVSKRCCPVCDNFLKRLGPDFIVRGSHSAISPCSLPPWTPPSLVKTMNEIFGQILKDDIQALLNTIGDGKRNRSQSTSSASLSIDDRHPVPVKSVHCVGLESIDNLY